MRIGVMARGETAQLDWAKGLGFQAIEWVAFDRSPAALPQGDWRGYADEIADAAKVRDMRISAIAALYANPLDPRQSERARELFMRAIEVAAHIGVRTVAGFSGAVVETRMNERGGNLVYRAFEEYIPRMLAYWEPIARFASDRGVRIAFENCPQGIWRLPVMGHNFFGHTGLWEMFFNATQCDNLGLEWDPSHLICQMVDPVANIRKFAARIFHVHAKDAFINKRMLEEYGICHPGVAEHRTVGLGQAHWGEIVHTLMRVGYDSDMTVEGRHDPVFRDWEELAEIPGAGARHPLAGRNIEDAGLRIAIRTLEQYIPMQTKTEGK
jgi:sugar phosphate isomerase/epimerase